jgi:hypothetical protein
VVHAIWATCLTTGSPCWSSFVSSSRLFQKRCAW